MAFQKGHTKIPGSGVQKGYTARRSRQNLKEVLERRNVNLIDEILDDLPNLRPQDRVDILMRLVEYTTPKLRAVEVVGMPATQLQVNIANTNQPTERSAFRQMLESPDTLAAVRLLDAQMDALPNQTESELDTNTGDIVDIIPKHLDNPTPNGSHLGESESFGQQTNESLSTEVPSQKIINPED